MVYGIQYYYKHTQIWVGYLLLSWVHRDFIICKENPFAYNLTTSNEHCSLNSTKKNKITKKQTKLFAELRIIIIFHIVPRVSSWTPPLHISLIFLFFRLNPFYGLFILLQGYFVLHQTQFRCLLVYLHTQRPAIVFLTVIDDNSI